MKEVDGISISHKLFLIRRSEGSRRCREWKQPFYYFMSLINMNRTQLLDLYAMTSPFTRRIVGVFYEGYCFKEIVDHGIHLNLLKMIRLVPSERERERGTRRKRQRAVREHEIIDIDEKDLSVQYYSSDFNGPPKKKHPTFPKHQTRNPLCIFRPQELPYILQFTIAEERSIRSTDGLFSKYSHCPRSRKFVFIIALLL